MALLQGLCEMIGINEQTNTYIKSNVLKKTFAQCHLTTGCTIRNIKEGCCSVNGLWKISKANGAT